MCDLPVMPEQPRKWLARRLDQEAEAAGGLFRPGEPPTESELLCQARLSVVLALLPLLLPRMPALRVL